MCRVLPTGECGRRKYWSESGGPNVRRCWLHSARLGVGGNGRSGSSWLYFTAFRPDPPRWLCCTRKPSWFISGPFIYVADIFPFLFIFLSDFLGNLAAFNGSAQVTQVAVQSKITRKLSQTLHVVPLVLNLNSSVSVGKFQKHWPLFSIFVLGGPLADGRHLHLAIDKATPTALTIFHQEERRQKTKNGC